MANESDKKPQLSINDPVDAATLKRIGEIQGRRFQLGDMMLDLEQEKVKILVEARRLDDERTRIFNQLLTSRGLAPTAPVEIDPSNGKITLLQTNGKQAQVAPPPVHPGAEAAPEAPPA